MERKIGEVFEIDGKEYKVAECIDDYMGYCDKCAFDGSYRCMSKKRGYCEMSNREDGKDVYFIEVKE